LLPAPTISAIVSAVARIEVLSTRAKKPAQWPPPSVRRKIAGQLRHLLPAGAFTTLQRGFDAGRRASYAARGIGRGRVLPDFLIIGAAKSGTTTLYDWINRHPLAVGAGQKQLHFFDWKYYLGTSWYRSNFPRAAERAAFEREHGRPFVTGEATPTYLSYSFLTVERVSALLPNVKLIAVFRNPADRAYSHYQMIRREGGEPLSFEEAVEREPERLDGEVERLLRDHHYRAWSFRSFSYLGRSRYADELQPWLERFPHERFLFLKAEDLSAAPDATLRRVFAFLGLPPHELDTYSNLNVAETYEPMAPATRAMLDEYFRPHNERLYELVGTDFGWGG
jgi:hypothetical protein